MHRVFLPRPHYRWLLLFFILIPLAACSRAPMADPSARDQRFDYISTIDVGSEMTDAELEALYGGRVIVRDTTSGFAVLGFTQKSAQLTSLTLEENIGTFSLTELVSSGANAWAGGANAWAGGANAWAGGSGALDPLLRTYTPADNAPSWRQIKLAEAHNKLSPNLGDGVVVAVIDTGLDLSHPVFADRLVPGWDYIGNDATPQDEGVDAFYGHGTAVAGVILQVAPLAKIMPLRILSSSGVGDTDDLVQAISFAVDHGARVINLSLGSWLYSLSVDRALLLAAQKGVAVVSSVSNSGSEWVTYPAYRATWDDTIGKALISVSSVGASDVKSSFAAYGKDRVEVMAPGETIFTALPNLRVGYANGTSFAAPMVSGALALALASPSLKKPVQELPQLVVDRTDNSLYNLAANLPYAGKLGKGRLDLESFLKRAM